jgi:hypothetical protein
MLSNPLVKTVVTVIAVVLFMKYLAPKIPVVGKYLTLS